MTGRGATRRRAARAWPGLLGVFALLILPLALPVPLPADAAGPHVAMAAAGDAAMAPDTACCDVDGQSGVHCAACVLALATAADNAPLPEARSPGPRAARAERSPSQSPRVPHGPPRLA